MGLLVSLLLSFGAALFFAWIIYWLDRYEKEPAILLGGVFIWGAVLAAAGAFLFNTFFGVSVYLLTDSEAATNLATGLLEAPFVEELLKGLAVLLVFIIFHNEFDSILDGIVYGCVAALGFAASENTFYIYRYGYLPDGFSGLVWLAFVRVVLVGWQHPFYTAFTGIGLAISRMSKDSFIKLAAPLAGFSIAVIAHALHNALGNFLKGYSGLAVGALYDWSGWVLMLLFIAWAILRERRWIINYLGEEVSSGLISAGQYRTAASSVSRSLARFNALLAGEYRTTSRFYQLCAELAHKKRQFATLGEEDGNSRAIERLRKDLAQLAPHARA